MTWWEIGSENAILRVTWLLNSPKGQFEEIFMACPQWNFKEF